MSRKRTGQNERAWLAATLETTDSDLDGGFVPEQSAASGICGDLKKRKKECDAVGYFPVVDDENNLICFDCSKNFIFSYLSETFGYSVCDECLNLKEDHKLITRTQAKDVFALKDVDFDRREPELRFMSKKNPRNPHWGDMRLYLTPQVKLRAVEVYGSMEKLELVKSEREANRQKAKEKQFKRKIDGLKREFSTSKVDPMKHLKPHVHVFGSENFDAKSDEYFQICTECNYKYMYEKM